MQTVKTYIIGNRTGAILSEYTSPRFNTAELYSNLPLLRPRANGLFCRCMYVSRTFRSVVRVHTSITASGASDPLRPPPEMLSADTNDTRPLVCTVRTCRWMRKLRTVRSLTLIVVTMTFPREKGQGKYPKSCRTFLAKYI